MDDIVVSQMRHSDRGIRDIIERYLLPNTIMVEIGCYAGESTSMWIESGKIQKIICIDPWRQHISIENEFDARMSPYMGKPDCPIEIIKLKSTSKEIASIFQNESLDFIYIDGCHLYESVKLDIISWLPKIKKSGYICGHDYDPQFEWSQGVVNAVNEIIGMPDEIFEDSSWIKKMTNM